MTDRAADLDLLLKAARRAGDLALSHRAQGLKIEAKPGGSPVTSGDLAVDAFLSERLMGARPDYGWLSEETADNADRLSRRRVFVVDPIDGTVAYMKHQAWWCVSLAIVEDEQPVVGVIHVPDRSETYTATLGGGAQLNGRPIHASDATELDDASVLADARFMQDPLWPEPWPEMRYEKRNALAYRMALVAAGTFDAAIALSPKWDWDVAAGALIAQEAGAKVSDHLGRSWRFNQPDPRQTSLVCSAPGLHRLILRRSAAWPL